MDKKKENAAPNDRQELNDELLDQVSGGVDWGVIALLRCSVCGYTADNPKYYAGMECPSCHKGDLCL